jgi:hypothetical protein
MALLSCQFNSEIPEFIPDQAKLEQIASEVEKEEKSKDKEKEMIEEEEEKIDTSLDTSVLLLLEYNDVIEPKKETYNLLIQEAKAAAQAAG